MHPPPPSSSSSHGGFSIREYTAEMRAADIAKCWPFGGCAGGEVESFLPPIRVVKFRWWLDVLSAAREIDVADVIPLGSVVARRNGLRLAGDDDNDQEEEVEVGELRRKKKKKKERSIVEIFAVTPRVAVRASKEERGTKKKKGVKVKTKTRHPITRMRVSVAKEVLERKILKTSSAVRIGEVVLKAHGVRRPDYLINSMMFNLSIHEIIDEDSDLKLQQEILTSNTSARRSCLENYDRDSFYPLRGKEKQASKSVCSHKKRNSGESWPDFDAKRQKRDGPGNLVRGTLRRLQFSSGQGSEIASIELGSLVTSDDTGEMRVKFTISARDDDHQSDERSTDDNNAVEAIIQQLAVDDDNSDSKRNRSDCEAIIDVKDLPDSSLVENPSEHVEPSANQTENLDFSEESRIRIPILTGLDQPLPSFDKRTMGAFPGPPYAGLSEIARPIGAAHADDRTVMGTLRYDHHHPSTPHPIYSPHPTVISRAVSEPSPANFAPTGCMNRGTLSLLCTSHPSAYQPLHPMHPPNPRGILYSFLADGSTSMDLSGLPLNSHGELIRVNSGGDHTHCDDHRFPFTVPVDDFRLRMTILGGASDQLDSFRMLDLSEQDPFSLHDVRLHPTTEVNYCRHNYREEGSIRGKGVACMDMCRVRASPSSAPLTMRLMGKDVPVSRSSQDMNGFEDGNIWTDKAILMEHRSPIIEKAFFSGEHRFSQKWTMHSDSTITKEAECQRRNPYFGAHNGEAELPILHHPIPVASPDSYSLGASFISNVRSQCHPMHRVPEGLDNVENICPLINGTFLYPEDKEYSQSSRRPIISGGLAPFPNPSTPVHGQASHFQSSNAIPPWVSISSASDPDKPLSFYYEPHLNPSMRSNSETIPASYARSTVNCLFRGENSSVLSSPPPPYVPVLQSIGLTKGNWRGGMRWNPTGISGSGSFLNSGQKPAAFLVDPKKHLRPLNLEPPFYPSASHAGETPPSIEFDFSTGTGIWGKYVGSRVDNLRPRTSHNIGLSSQLVKAKETANPGPTKRTAWAKHTLKPSSDTNKAGSGAVHSTIRAGIPTRPAL